MGKAKGVSRRRIKNKNPRFVHRSKLNKKKVKLRKSRTTKDKIIKEKWDPKKGTKSNLKSMGLIANPNVELKDEPMDLESNTNTKKTEKNNQVLKELEKEASKPTKKNFRFSGDMVKFCVYMIETHGNDYKAMERDKRNYYQESAGQIKKKIEKFKSIPEQWNVYLNSKKNLDEKNSDILMS